MTMLFIDGFENYGAGAGALSAMLQGPYTNVPAAASGGWAVAVSTNSPRTQDRAIVFPARSGASLGGVRGFYHAITTGAQNTIGAAISWQFVSAMAATGACELLTFRNANNVAQVTITQTATGQIAAIRGYARNGSGSYPNGTALGVTPAPVLFTGAYQHIEARVLCHPSNGSVEVRVDGVTVLSIAGVNTQNNASPGGIAVVGYGYSNVATPASFDVVLSYVDDFYVWDTNGDFNNDFIGVRGAYWLPADGNELPQDWSVEGVANAFEALGKSAPDDDSYIYVDDTSLGLSPPVEPESRFSLANLPSGIGAISAIQAVVRQLKTDSGPANTRIGLVRDGDYAGGVSRPITTAATYWFDIFETDPATGAPWSKSTADAAILSIARTNP